MRKAGKNAAGKVCEICGVFGKGRDIATCCRCKKIHEHIYCMEEQLFVVPEIWYCNECCEIQKSGIQDTTRPLLDDGVNPKQISSDAKLLTRSAKRLCTQASSPTLLDDGVNPKQISSDVKLLTRSAKRLRTQESSPTLSGKEERVPVASSPPGKHPTKPLSRNTSLKAVEKGRVKFISSEEVVSLTSRVRISNLGSSLRTNQANSRSPTIKRKKYSKLVGSKKQKVLPLENKEPVDSDTQHSPSMPIMPIEQLTDEQGEKVPATPCNEKFKSESIRGEAGVSSSQGLILAGAECDFNLPPAPICDEQMEKPMSTSSNEGDIVTLLGDDKCKVQDMTHNEIALNVAAAGGSGTVICSDARFEKSVSQEMLRQLMLLINPEEKFPNRRAPEACWKGTIEVFEEASHIYEGIQAYFPSQVSHKAYEISKLMPEKLKFKTIPRKDAWPQIFQLHPPMKDDIALFFFPSEHERPKENYLRLLERIDSHDFAMIICINDVELLVYTSKQLPVDCQLTGIAAQTYLWGIFRHVKRRKSSHHTIEKSSCSPATPMRSGGSNIFYEDNPEIVDMEIDMVGGHEIDALPSFVKPGTEDPNQLTSNCNHGTERGSKTTASELEEMHSKHHQVADHYHEPSEHHRSSPHTPLSGFNSFERPDSDNEIELHHDDTKLHGTTVDMKFDMAGGNEIDALPGFVKPGSEDPNQLKRSLIKFPLKKITLPILPDVPPGFTRTPNCNHGTKTGSKTTASELEEMHSKRHQVADDHHEPSKHHRSSPHTPLSENNAGFNSFEWPKSENEMDLHHEEEKFHPVSKSFADLLPNVQPGGSSLEVIHKTSMVMEGSHGTTSPESLESREWISLEVVQKRKVKLQRKLDMMHTSPVVEDQTMTCPEECNTEEESKGKLEMDSESELKSSGAILALFPERETMESFGMKQNVGSNSYRQSLSVCQDLTLSRPQYVGDRYSFIEILSRERLEQDRYSQEKALSKTDAREKCS